MAREFGEFLIFRLGSWTLFVQQALRSPAALAKLSHRFSAALP